MMLFTAYMILNIFHGMFINYRFWVSLMTLMALYSLVKKKYISKCLGIFPLSYVCFLQFGHVSMDSFALNLFFLSMIC